MKIKLAIKLSDEQSEAYSISTESMWFVKEGNYFRLINIPFFIEDISMEDLLSLKKSTEDTYSVERIVEESLNSTVWITLNDEAKGKKCLTKLHSIGCGYESGVLAGYYAVNIPNEVEKDEAFRIIELAEKSDALLSYNASLR